jgi:hypothetical protein
LAPIVSRTVHRGSTVRFQAQAADADIPAQQLLFSLNSTPPSTATLDTHTGQFEWTADVAPGTNIFDVHVSDGAIPPLSDTQTFSVVVLDQPIIQSITFTAPDTVTITWTAIAGQRYRLESKESLDDPQWTTLPNDIVAPASNVTATDTSSAGRFYRVRVVQD